MRNDYNPNIGNNRLYKITQRISWFFIITLWFLLSYIPLLLLSLIFEAEGFSILLYLIGVIPLGPAISGLIGASIYVVEENDFSEPGKDYRKYYRKNCVDSFKIWLPYLILIYLSTVNINYYINLSQSSLDIVGYVFVFIIIILTLYLIILFLIQSKFQFRYQDLLKLAAYYLIVKLKRTIGNFFVIFIVLFLSVTISPWLLLAIPALISYILVLYNYSLIKDIKINFIKKE